MSRTTVAFVKITRIEPAMRSNGTLWPGQSCRDGLICCKIANGLL